MLRILVAALFSALIWTVASAADITDRWAAEGWRTDFTKMHVDPNQILSGGPPKDGIPPIETPSFQRASENSELKDQDPVIGLEINGDARAYPLQVMMWHEIVNDIVGGKPVVVTYCPLCNAALVFDAVVGGEPHTFGTTGKLRNSDLIMYDRTTESWWQQFTGDAIAGAYLGTSLTLIPARLESWKDFKSRHPKGKVLVPNNENMRNYGRNPYVGYDISSRPFLYNGSMPKGIEPMARVVVVRRADKVPLIVTLTSIRESGAFVQDGYKISWKPGQASALHTAAISEGRDVGTIEVSRQVGNNRHLVAYDVTFAFVAHAFHPDQPIIGK